MFLMTRQESGKTPITWTITATQHHKPVVEFAGCLKFPSRRDAVRQTIEDRPEHKLRVNAVLALWRVCIIEFFKIKHRKQIDIQIDIRIFRKKVSRRIGKKLAFHGLIIAKHRKVPSSKIYCKSSKGLQVTQMRPALLVRMALK